VKVDGEIRLADLLRERTRQLHSRAERSGIVREILRGSADRLSYSLLLRNLLPAYRELEIGLRRHREAPGVRWLVEPAVFRADALERDLANLCGADWERSLPLLPAGRRYAQRVADVVEDYPAGLIAHAYVRYFGDLSGGQILRQLLAVSPGLAPEALSFFSFSLVGDLQTFKLEYRCALNRAGVEIEDWGRVVDEALAAFQLNVELSESVHATAAQAR
jgi:heme oxygenase